jgi:hypothetical protein
VEDLWILLVDIGKVTDAAGKSSYDLLGYGKNVAKGMASDQKQGYFGFWGKQVSLMLNRECVIFGGGTRQFNVTPDRSSSSGI